MSWNYRVIRHTVDGETGYGVHEVYYNEDGKPIACTEEPAKPYGETPDELAKDVLHFASALEKPVLDYSYFVEIAKG